MQQVGVQGSRPAGEGRVTSFASMTLLSGLGVFRTAVIVGITSVVAYRVRSASFKRTVLTGNGGPFEDSVDNSGERYTHSSQLQQFRLYRSSFVGSHAIDQWLHCSMRRIMHSHLWCLRLTSNPAAMPAQAQLQLPHRCRRQALVCDGQPGAAGHGWGAAGQVSVAAAAHPPTAAGVLPRQVWLLNQCSCTCHTACSFH